MIRKICLLAAMAISFGILPLAGKAALWTSYSAAKTSQASNASHFVADSAALRARLAQAPHEVLLDRSHSIELPMPDGSLQKFSVVDSPIMPAPFTARFASMKTFKLRGIDDPAISGRADITMKGFRAMLSTPRGSIFIEPEPPTPGLYRSVMRPPAGGRGFACGVHDLQQSPVAHVRKTGRPSNRLAMNYQTYRIAVAATHEYVAAVGGSDAARAEILTAINRVNQIYERDLGIRLLLVENDGDLLEEDDQTCFTNEDQFTMLEENQLWIDERIGSGAYDIGHVFATSNGGVARFGGACQDDFKANGVTGLPNPVGDTFYVDFVAHEIGHQLSATHTFNGTTGNCVAPNRNPISAFEPGSGSTVMSYAGTCSTENLQAGSDATFHAASIEQIDTFTAGNGSCYRTIVNGNTDPVLTPLADHAIPPETPFRLAAVATDADLDTLSYQWDQMDSGSATDNTSFGTDLGDNALFRTYVPQSDNYRDFPALGTQLLGQTDKAETLSVGARSIDFRVTVRDGNSGQDSDDIRLTVTFDGSFQVTGPNGGTMDTSVTPFTVTWDPAGTAGGSINCANVDIDLLTFSDAAYTRYSVHSIAAGVANDGSEDVVASMSHPLARVRIMCSDNVFYDISDADVNVVGTSLDLYPDDAFTTFFNSNGNGFTVSREAATRDGLVDPFAGRSRSSSRLADCRAHLPNGDASALEPLWLLSLAGLIVLVRLGRRYGLQ